MNSKDTAVLETRVGGASQTMQDIQSIKDSLRDLKQETLELNAAKAQQDAHVQKNKASLNAYEKQLADANRTIVTATEKNKELTTKLTDLEKKNQQGSDQWNKLTGSITENNAKINEAETVIKDVTVKHNELLAVQKEEIGTRNGLSKQIRENNQKVKEQVVELNRLNGTLDITEMSYSQLSAKSMQLRRELNNTSRAANPEQWDLLNRELGQVETQMDKVRAGTRETGKEMNGFKGMMDKVSFAIKAFILIRVVDWLRDVAVGAFNTRKEYAKYEAVLRNSLQSTERAARSMGMLRDLAKETPFELDELTQAYIKMINRGLNPTRAEIVKLGDVAASQGKSLDMLIEAMLDASTGEFERLKEFGIKARKEGENVKFTFKGITTEVKYTEDAISDYILSLGTLTGVQGGMAVQMEELEGKTSNLSDTWKEFLNTLGTLVEPAAKKVLGFLTNMLGGVRDGIAGLRQLRQEARTTDASAAYDNTGSQFDTMVASLVKNGMEKKEAIERSIKAMRKTSEADLQDAESQLAAFEKKYGSNTPNKKLQEQQEQIRTNIAIFKAELDALADKAKDATTTDAPVEDKNAAKKAEAAEKAALKARLDAVDQYIVEKRTKLTQDMLDGKTMYETYNAELQALELENLNKKLEVQGLDAEARKKVELDVLEFKKKIMDEEFEEYVDLVEEKGKASEKDKLKQSSRLDDLADDLNKYVERISQSERDAIEIRKGVGSSILDFASSLGQTLGESLTDTESTFADVMGNILLLSLDTLRQIATMAIAERTIKNIATLGPLGLAKSAAEIALINAAFYAVKGLIKKPTASGASTSTSKESESKSGTRTVTGLASGGYMPVTRAQDGANYMAAYDPGRRGFVSQPTVLVGESGPEFVVSNAGINNPTVRPLIDLIDSSQRAGTIRTVDLNQIMRTRMAGFASGGFTTAPETSTPDVPSVSTTTNTTPVDNRILNELITLLRSLNEYGIDARVVYSQLQKVKNTIEKSKKIGSKG